LSGGKVYAWLAASAEPDAGWVDAGWAATG
jgi:hypothetical protein